MLDTLEGRFKSWSDPKESPQATDLERFKAEYVWYEENAQYWMTSKGHQHLAKNWPWPLDSVPDLFQKDLTRAKQQQAGTIAGPSGTGPDDFMQSLDEAFGPGREVDPDEMGDLSIFDQFEYK